VSAVLSGRQVSSTGLIAMGMDLIVALFLTYTVRGRDREDDGTTYGHTTRKCESAREHLEMLVVRLFCDIAREVAERESSRAQRLPMRQPRRLRGPAVLIGMGYELDKARGLVWTRTLEIKARAEDAICVVARFQVG
jgi:hypothetical protein